MQSRNLAQATLATVLAALLLLAVVACGGEQRQQTGPGDHGHALPDGAGPVPGALPDDSVQEALARIYSWQPVTDADSGAGMKRALPWLSGQMRQVAERGSGDQVRPMRQWPAWRQEKAIIGATVKVIPKVDDPADKSVTRQATVFQEIQRADGSVDAFSLVTYDVDVALDKDDCWRVWRITTVGSQTLPDGVSQ